MAGLLEDYLNTGYSGGLLGSAEMRPYNPTWRDRIGSWMMGSGHASPERRAAVSGLVGSTGLGSTGMSVADFTPVGMAFSANEYQRAQSPGDAFAAAAGLVPGAKPAAGAVKQGIRAYHGSPHSFDKFDMSKIGTGEGAQAYGHGLYFAGNEEVAKSYKKAGPASNAQYDEINSELSRIARERDTIKSQGFYPGSSDWEARKAKYIELGGEYDALMEKRTKLGNMYEVNINARPEQFLDWDKPLSEQPQAVREMVDKVKGSSYIAQNKLNDAATGADLYHKMRSPFAAKGVGYDDWSKTGPSNALREAGIPGIKYLDRGSRGAGEGTSNYVVFDDSLIEILRKYGLAAGGLLGAGAMAGGQDQPLVY